MSIIKPFLLHAQKVKSKIQISWEQEKLLRWNKKAFFIIFEGLSLKQIKTFFLKGESPTLILENMSNLTRLAFDIDDFFNSHQDGGNMSVLRTLLGRTIPSLATWCKSKRTSDHKLTWKSEKTGWKIILWE